ncbi:hypothetical protein [Streptomyces sp. NBC_01264]|uniref:hypothetical protein n=1 Tax=Streptomyces sp. NBC_01264 TaxID=2903804 RepID=UPI002256B840|nr:hypothetical protein [Streptomyces sp. NBC_01264]MCX4781899.1 hypothetical protein [Streptomyces sp. NBC_01264]
MGAGTEPDGSSRSDEEWERFLRESVAGAVDAPKEPSARARAVAKRLRSEPAAGPAGWRTYTPARPKRRTGWYVAGFLLSIVLLLVALAPERVLDLFAGGGSGSAPLAGETARPTQGPPSSSAQRPTRDEPFRGSPAESWASGAAGITVPQAAPVGRMSAAEVEQALGRSLDFLVTSNLDPGVLRGERPAKAIALINPHQKDVQDLLAHAFTSPGEKNDPLLLFSRFRPSHTQLVGDVVKTRGRLAYQEGEHGGLQVTADVTFVYPVTRAGGGGEDHEIERTIVRRELVLSWDDPDKVLTEAGTFSVVSYKYNMTNAGCGAPTGYLTPPFGTDRRATEPGTEMDPYDRSAPVTRSESSVDECGTATRS